MSVDVINVQPWEHIQPVNYISTYNRNGLNVLYKVQGQYRTYEICTYSVNSIGTFDPLKKGRMCNSHFFYRDNSEPKFH